MARRITTVGSGFTQKNVTSYSGPDMAPAMRQWVAEWNAGIQEGGGVFGAVSLRAIKACRTIVAPESAFADEVKDLAASVVRDHEIAVARVASGDADAAARSAFDVGVAWATLALKLAWEADGLAGAAFRSAGGGGGRPAGSTLERDVEMAREFTQCTAGASNRSWTAHKVAIGKKNGLGKTAAFAAISRGLENLVANQG